ncbi:hypothetical protein M0R89_09840 [Halorussus limi]|uniref:Uncharacterized protein n=1 Tax=Halorussus limi TaxID=2938695 RepID=A0A8U0HPR2_9EURY|nr:hypothetical protein [Halorussus limi]UPV72851.1 hypothetical protein M0R89_09840 [Halorussus limi]
MGTFEEIAVLDLKFRAVIVAAVMTFVGVSMPILVVFRSELGLVFGAIAAVVAGYLTAKRVS